MFSFAVLLTLLATVVMAAITCALVLAADAAWPAALLSAGTAGAATFRTVSRLLGKDRREDEQAVCVPDALTRTRPPLHSS